MLKNVIKTYENAAGKFTALKGIDLSLNYGQFVSIVGKSGSGKSTLLNMLTGIDRPTQGEVIINEILFNPATGGCGGCKVVPGPIEAGGSCTAWAPKPT